MQKPLLMQLRASRVVCVGLSAKLRKFPDEEPLDIRTNSGRVISKLEELCGFSFYKTNLVKCAPLENSKLRYPTKKEITYCMPHLRGEIAELQPKVVLMLGKQVTNGIARERGFTPPQLYHSVQHHDITYLAIPHPSYLWVYKRKELTEILTKISQLITQAITDAG
jgi:DNA polymerase